ncbi:serine protease [Pseudooceanicola sp.]|uniref:serine protease n=1 Tax=Pseudooceanicola sp. TaxID=1914328 RepID=UPI0026242AAE|nr:serine protease [Pseudooceanicola sp.]MDF1854812.1 serine protease [Pseudooceanicola sp.]
MTFLARPAVAQQELVWVQIEAQPTLADAQASIRNYAARLQDVNGFSLGGGWYAVALGPYTRDDAGRVLFVLRNEGAIPRDSYIAFASAFQQQFYPVGASTGSAAAVPPEPTQPDQATSEPSTAADPQPVALPDESPAEARRSEAQLSREERMELQVMLKWAGYYNAGIDGAFGSGTRRSMAEWQRANGHEPTGILTTMQRAELLKQYNSVLDGLGLRRVRDDRAGIDMLLPTAVVKHDSYQAPFAHFSPTGDIPAQVVLISQEGDAATLAGLYEIMQTLEIVPENGPRERKDTAFTLIGEDARMVSYTEAALENGQIKGFTLVWPAGDEERRLRLLSEMRGSFQPLAGVLEASAGLGEDQRIDLVSGLEVRKPRLSRSGFYADQSGTVVTVAEAVQSCGRITLDQGTEAQVAAIDASTGLAILRPTSAVAPIGSARFASAVPRLNSDVAVSGYPYEGVLGAPTLTFGQLAEFRGLDGESDRWRLDLVGRAGDAGGPVLDQAGAVLGVLLPATQGSRKLPQGVSFIADTDAVLAALESAGVAATRGGTGGLLAPEDLTKIGQQMTVLVSCWE